MQLHALLKAAPRGLLTISAALNRQSRAVQPLSLHLVALPSFGKPVCKLKHSISWSRNKSQFVIKEYSLNKHSCELCVESGVRVGGLAEFELHGGSIWAPFCSENVSGI